MRVLVTGSRDWQDGDYIRSALVPYAEPGAILVHGDCRGADWIARDIWKGWGLKDEPHPAAWRVDGGFRRNAGFVRNSEMVNLGADVCLAFILNQSKGATMCADLAEKAGIDVRRFEVTDSV